MADVYHRVGPDKLSEHSDPEDDLDGLMESSLVSKKLKAIHPATNRKNTLRYEASHPGFINALTSFAAQSIGSSARYLMVRTIPSIWKRCPSNLSMCAGED